MSNVQVGAPLNHEINPHLQWMEISSTLQIPQFHIIGLPGPEVAESKERVRAAIDSSGFEFPKRRVVLNLSPASIRKQGTGIDLGIALTVLNSGIASKTKNLAKTALHSGTQKCVAWGELGLDGKIKSAGQPLRTLSAALAQGADLILLSPHDQKGSIEAWSLLRQISQFQNRKTSLGFPETLEEAWELFKTFFYSASPPASLVDLSSLTPEQPKTHISSNLPRLLPISTTLQRTLCLAASGAHHLLLLGPKGTGKTHAMEWLQALQPPSSAEEIFTQAIMSELHGQTPSIGNIQRHRRIGTHSRPSTLLGTVSTHSFRPGEYSLAHGGLLIADEFPEWPRDTRESLRDPMERGWVTLSRARASYELPAQFVLAANGNLCPCGGIMENPEQSKSKRCRCLPGQREEYLGRLSGPVLDRIDLIYLQRASENASTENGLRGDLLKLKEQVAHVQTKLVKRWGKPPGKLDGHELESILKEHSDWRELLDQTPAKSLRSRHKILRISLTLSAWENTDLTQSHFLEASCYRAERLF